MHIPQFACKYNTLIRCCQFVNKAALSMPFGMFSPRLSGFPPAFMMFASKILLIRRNDPTQFAVFSAGPVADSSAFWKRKKWGCSKTVLKKEEAETAENSRLGFMFVVRWIKTEFPAGFWKVFDIKMTLHFLYYFFRELQDRLGPVPKPELMIGIDIFLSDRTIDTPLLSYRNWLEQHLRWP